MIVRTWHGCVPLEYAQTFAAHLQKTGVEHAQSIDGNLGVHIKQMAHNGYEHFFFASYWVSLEAVKKFAGDQYQLAVHYPEDDVFHLIADPYVFHHVVSEIQPL